MFRLVLHAIDMTITLRDDLEEIGYRLRLFIVGSSEPDIVGKMCQSGFPDSRELDVSTLAAS